MKAKDFLLRFAIAICFALTASNTFAYDFEVDRIYYNVTSLENLEVEVTSYCYYLDDEYDEHKYSGDIVIPETVTYKNRELSVTSIGDAAFWDCSGLTSVDIPDGVTSIGYSAFSYCDTIEEFVFPAGVDQYPQDERGDNYYGLFGHYEESNYIGTYTGTLVKNYTYTTVQILFVLREVPAILNHII